MADSPLDGQSRIEGTVLQWNEKGFGFIGLPDERRAYVHCSQFGGGNLIPGEKVSAVIVEDPVNPGKWQAKAVRRSFFQQDLPQTDLLEGNTDPNRLQCVVAEWNLRGFGFILVPDGRRAYVHVSQTAGKNLHEGESVVATIVQDKQNPGKWAAMDVKRVLGFRQSTCVDYLKGQCKRGDACRYAHSTRSERDQVVQVSEISGERETCVDFLRGRCTRENCQFEHDMRPRIRQLCLDFMKGQCTRFPCRYAHSEEEQRDMRETIMQPASSSSAPSPSGAGDQDSGFEWGSNVDVSSPPLGYWPELEGLPQQRQMVEPRQISEVRDMGRQGTSVSNQSGQRMEGKIVEWNSERGFGFLELKDGRRVYVHNSAFGGGDLQAGVTVNGIIIEDPNSIGKLRAEEVQLGKWPPMQSMPRQANPQQQPQQMSGMDDMKLHKMEQQMANMQMQMASQQMASQIQMAQMAQMEQMQMSQMSQMPPMGMMAMQSPMGPMMVPVMMGPGMPMNPMMCSPMMGNPAMAMAATNAMALMPPEEKDETRYEGVVVKWEEKGYGFVEFGPNAQLPEKIRAYCHSKSFGGGDLAVGEVVNAILSEDKKNPGKWAVDDVLRGPLGDDGTLISWKQDKGFGFVELDDGRRVYIHHSSFGGGNLELGVRLRVDVKPDELNPGKWSVAAVKCELSPDDDIPSKVPLEEIEAAKQAQVPMNTCIDFLKGSCTRGELCRFAHSETKPGTPSGLTKMCSAYLTGICLYDDNCKFAHSMRANPACEKIPEQEQRQECVGVVSEWQTKGYGFILLEDNRRAYVHHSAFTSGNLEVGERVTCVVIPDRRNRGKFMVESLTRAPENMKQVVEEWTEGKVVDFNIKQKDGYVKLADGRKCYVPASVLFGGYLILGEEIQAKPTQDKHNPGRWMVVCVRGDGCVGGSNEPHAKRLRLM